MGLELRQGALRRVEHGNFIPDLSPELMCPSTLS